KGALAKRIVEDSTGCAQKILFRKRFLLAQKNPGPVRRGELCIGAGPSLRDRDDVKHCETPHSFRMIERETIGNAATTIVADQIELREAKLVHHCHKFVPHCSL